LPTPFATQVAGLDATVIPLPGPDAAPIDAVAANGSIWVALHRGDAIVRIDPADGTVQATIPVTPGTGPGWFAVGGGSIWVTNQNSVGISRIDPATNEIVSIGTDSPCGPPAFVDGSAWINACDAPALVRYDAATEAEAERIDVAEPITPMAVNGELWGFGESGTYRLDAKARTMKRIADCCAALTASIRGDELWLAADEGLHVLNLRSRKFAWELPLQQPVTVAFAHGSAWVVGHDHRPSLTQIDLATHKVIRSEMLGLQPIRILAVGGRLWVTDMLMNRVSALTP
jgi:DNA-binding beta-propeller fold protein YncE